MSFLKKMQISIENFSELEIEEIRKNIKDEDPDQDKYAVDDKHRKSGSVRRLFKEFNRDYYKPTIIDKGFAGEVNYYIKYKSEGIKMKNYHLKNIFI